MKAFKIALIAAAAVLSASFSACGNTVSGTYEGEYKYGNPYEEGMYYGVKVCVEVQKDIIKSVSVVQSDYVEASQSNEEWGWDNTVYLNGRDDLLAAYNGKTVTEILALTVITDESGEPYASADVGFVSYGKDLLVSGATLSSGRLLLAVQNALKNA